MLKSRTFKYLNKDRSPVFSNPGNKIRIEFSLKWVGSDMYLEEKRRVEIQPEISSHLEGCSLARMLSRYSLGDPEALEKDPGRLYGDFSAVGGSYDLQTMQETAKAAAAHVDAQIARRKANLMAKGKAAEEAAAAEKKKESEVSADGTAADSKQSV